MKILAISVAISARAAALVAAKTGDMTTALLAATTLICAYTTYKSQHISSYLKIFVAVFAVEVIAFGVFCLVEALHLWPASWADYEIPESLAADGRAFRDRGLLDILHPARQRDDADRGSLLRFARHDDGADLAVSAFPWPGAQSRGRDGGFSCSDQPGGSRHQHPPFVLLARLVQRDPDAGREGLLVSAVHCLSGLGFSLYFRGGGRICRHLDIGIRWRRG